MRFCQPHWERLKQAIEDKGMMHLVKGSGEKCARASIDNSPAPIRRLISTLSLMRHGPYTGSFSKMSESRG